eukprot:jgi/Galph1/1245/GphlegSOOS_G5992.1
MSKDAQGYVAPSLTVDAAVVRGAREAQEILLVIRKKEPFQNRLAFPGGFVEYGEDPEKAVLRELEEECGIKGVNPRLVAVRGKPDRPSKARGHNLLLCRTSKQNVEVRAGDDASACGWYAIDMLVKSPRLLAFDHYELLKGVLKFLDDTGRR